MSTTVTKNGVRLLSCADCDKVVATTPISDDDIIRAVIMCPECYAKEVGIEL